MTGPIDPDEAPRFAVPQAVQRLAAACLRTDVPLLDRYGLPEGQVTWRVWPRPSGSAGNGPAPAVLLVHGGSGSWTHWVPTIPALQPQATVLAADTPGYGDSGRVPGGTPVAGLAERLARTLDAVWPAARGPVAVVGFSFGGIVAGQLVEALLRADPHRVRQLVVVGSVGLGFALQGELPMQPWRDEADPARLAEIHRQNLLTLMLKHSASADDAAIAIQDANLRRTRYVSKREARGTALADAIRRLPIPVHGIWGDGDVTADGRAAELPALLDRLKPGTRCDLIPDCGHWAMAERPEAFNRLLLNALGLAMAD